MSEGGLAALIAIFLAAIPFLIASVVIGFFVLMIAFLVILENVRLRDLFLAVLVVFDAIILVPLWIGSKIVINTKPDLWATAKSPVTVFVIVLLAPTVIYLCVMVALDVRRGAKEKQLAARFEKSKKAQS